MHSTASATRIARAAIDLEQIAGGDDEQRPQPLAAADRGVAHRLVEPAAGIGGNGEQRRRSARSIPAPTSLERGFERHSPPNGARARGAPSRPNWICSIRACAACEPRLALLLQPVALAVEFDRLVERGLAALQLADDLLEPLQRRFEGELGNVFLLVCHGASIGPAADPGQGEAGRQARG